MTKKTTSPPRPTLQTKASTATPATVTSSPTTFCLPDADVDDEEDEDVDLINELEAELMAPESPVLAAATLPSMPPLPPPPKQKKKKRRSKKTLADVLGVDFVDEEKLHAKFESLVAESRMRTGVTAAHFTAPEPGSGSECS